MTWPLSLPPLRPACPWQRQPPPLFFPILTSLVGTKLASKSMHISAATRSSQINSCSSYRGPSGIAVLLNGCMGGPGLWPAPPPGVQEERTQRWEGEGDGFLGGTRPELGIPPPPLPYPRHYFSPNSPVMPVAHRCQHSTPRHGLFTLSCVGVTAAGRLFPLKPLLILALLTCTNSRACERPAPRRYGPPG